MIYFVGLKVIHDKLGNGVVVYIKQRNSGPDLVAVKFDVYVKNEEDVYDDQNRTHRFLASTDKLRELK